MNAKLILVMGLPTAGKTTFSILLQARLKCPMLNGDHVRKEFKDYDMSEKSREVQAIRMRYLCYNALRLQNHEYIIADFVCPTTKTRKIFGADHTVFLDTIKESPYDDTNKLFEIPVLFKEFDLRIGKKENIETCVEYFYWRILMQKEYWDDEI